MANFELTGVSTTARILLLDEQGYVGPDGALLSATVGVTMSDAILINRGFIGGAIDGVQLTGLSPRIINYGEITGTGAASSSGISAPDFAGATQTLFLTNYGSISASGAAGSALELNTGGMRLVNLGEMTSTSDVVIDLDDQNGGTTGYRIINHGRIVAGPIVVAAIQIFNDDSDVITNTGLISGGIETGGGSDTVRNQGTIRGSILLGAGVDVFDGRGGSLIGSVFGEAGDDLFIVDGTGYGIAESEGGGNDTVRAYGDIQLANNIEVLELIIGVEGLGNASANTITANNAANLLDGAEGNDTIEGRNGADTIHGDDGDDSLFGEIGADEIRGGSGRDTLSGGSGNDTLDGGDANDRIVGVGGDDRIVGALGADVMFGGAGADSFVYRTAGDSGTTATTRDRIDDFTSGSDRIDLSAIDANVNNAPDTAFTFVGALSGNTGQLDLRVVGPDGFLEGDVNGDGLADFSILLTGVTALLATDLIL